MMEVQSYPIVRSCPMSPPAEYAKYRLEGPLAKVRLWNGSEAWLVTRYSDVRSVLLDKRFSESPTTPGYPTLSSAREALVEGGKEVTHAQGEDHKRLRLVLARELTVKRVESQRPGARDIINKLIDEMIAHGGPVDLARHFALQLPTRVISGMLGVPYEDHGFFQENSNRRIALDLPPHVPVEATKEMRRYFGRLLKERMAGTGDDLLTRIARDHIATGAISHEEGELLAYTLVQAGHETTANVIALGVLLLMQNPDQLKALLADPGLVNSAAEEMLRFTTVLQFGMARAALEDVEIGGQVVRKGEGLFAMLISANHDPEVFPNPEVFDVSRCQRNHVAFSYGVHQCAGQQLARMELQEVFSRLFQRLPGLRLAVPFEALRFKHQNVVFGVETLPVVW